MGWVVPAQIDQSGNRVLQFGKRLYHYWGKQNENKEKVGRGGREKDRK